MKPRPTNSTRATRPSSRRHSGISTRRTGYNQKVPEDVLARLHKGHPEANWG